MRVSVPDRGGIRARRPDRNGCGTRRLTGLPGRGDPVDIDPALRTSVRANGPELLAVGDERAKESDRMSAISRKDQRRSLRARRGLAVASLLALLAVVVVSLASAGVPRAKNGSSRSVRSSARASER